LSTAKEKLVNGWNGLNGWDDEYIKNNDVGLSVTMLASKIGYRSSNFGTIPAANNRTSIFKRMKKG